MSVTANEILEPDERSKPGIVQPRDLSQISMELNWHNTHR